MIEVAKSVDSGVATMLGRVRAKVADPGVDLTWRPDPKWNLYGAIAAHICYATCALLGPRSSGLEMPMAAPADVWSGAGTDRDSLLALVDQTAAFSHRALDSMTAERWQETIEAFGRTMTRGEMATNALLHGAQHFGQMLLMDRVRTTGGGQGE